MNTIPKTPLLLAVCWGMLLVAAPAVEAADSAGKAIVRKVVGAARYSQGETWKLLGVGEELTAGVVIRTGKESRVELVFPDGGSGLSLLEDSTVQLSKLRSETIRGEMVCDLELELKAGRIEAEVTRLAATSKFEVKVSEGVIGVRRTNTWFSFAADCSLNVRQGSVVLVYLNEKKSGREVMSLVVGAGEKFNPASLKVEPIGN